MDRAPPVSTPLATEFLKSFQPLEHYSPSDRADLLEISKSISSDLSPSVPPYFSLETQEQIARASAERLKTQGHPGHWRQTWRQIVVDFHQNDYWGYQAQSTSRPKPPATPEQKVQRELFPYVWALVQTVVITKALVYYFGMQFSNEPSPSNDILFAIAVIFSFGSLFVFAWRKSRKN
jgi:hypothetical protein